MSIKLLSIQFHDPANGGQTLPLQRLRKRFPPCPDPQEGFGATEPVPVPEWKKGVSSQPLDAPVVMCLGRLGGHPPAIRVRLLRVEAPASVEVRAVDATGSNLLGGVEPTTVNFLANEVEAQLYLADLTAHSVASHDDVFQWQWRESARLPWQDLGRSKHRVCITLEVPQTPWDMAANAPWIEVIDLAARWAASAITVADCASKITRAVFALGEVSSDHAEFTYGASNLTSNTNFDCATFLAALAGCPFPQSLDCLAASSIVCTFANSLGAQLIETSLVPADGSVQLLTRPIRCLGQAEFGRRPFNLHSVASMGKGTAQDPVWDACLLVSRSNNPEEVPHGGINATGMAFGDGTDSRYLWRFLAPDQNGPIVITPAAQNRSIGITIQAARSSAEPPVAAHPGWFYWNFRLLPEFLGWTPLRNVIPVFTGALTAIDSIWTPSGDPLDKVQVVIESHASHRDAYSRFRVRQSQYSLPLMEAKIGDFGLTTLDETAVLLVRGNLFVEIHVAGPVERRLLQPALAFDRGLTQTAPLQGAIAAASAPISLEEVLPVSQHGVTYWYRVHTDTGEIRVREDIPYLYPEGPGIHDVFVYAYDPNGQMTPSVHSFQSL